MGQPITKQREMTDAEAEQAAAAIGLRMAADGVLGVMGTPANPAQAHALDCLRRSAEAHKAACAAVYAERYPTKGE